MPCHTLCVSCPSQPGIFPRCLHAQTNKLHSTNKTILRLQQNERGSCVKVWQHVAISCRSTLFQPEFLTQFLGMQQNAESQNETTTFATRIYPNDEVGISLTRIIGSLTNWCFFSRPELHCTRQKAPCHFCLDLQTWQVKSFCSRKSNSRETRSDS